MTKCGDRGRDGGKEDGGERDGEIETQTDRGRRMDGQTASASSAAAWEACMHQIINMLEREGDRFGDYFPLDFSIHPCFNVSHQFICVKYTRHPVKISKSDHYA